MTAATNRFQAEAEANKVIEDSYVKTKPSFLIAQGRCATRREINSLFHDYVCERTCWEVVKAFSDIEIKRLVCLGIYKYHVKIKEQNKSRWIDRICKVLCLSNTAIYKYIKNDNNFLYQ